MRSHSQSEATTTLLARLAAAGHPEVSPRRLETWRAAGMLPRADNHGRGGSRLADPEAAISQAIACAKAATRHPRDLAAATLEVWVSGFPVPHENVRKAALGWLDDPRIRELEDAPEKVARDIATRHQYRAHGQRWRKRRQQGRDPDAYYTALLAVTGMVSGSPPSGPALDELRVQSGIAESSQVVKQRMGVTDEPTLEIEPLLGHISLDSLIGAIQTATPEAFEAAREIAAYLRDLMFAGTAVEEETDLLGLAFVALACLPGAPLQQIIQSAVEQHLAAGSSHP